VRATEGVCEQSAEGNGGNCMMCIVEKCVTVMDGYNEHLRHDKCIQKFWLLNEKKKKSHF
jgi:hypothetical protein